MKRVACTGMLLIALAACTKTPPASNQVNAPPSAGAKLFQEKCAMCHRTGGMGSILLARRMDPLIAELEKRRDLGADYIVRVVRTGAANMPPLSRGEVSDAQLGEIALYLSNCENARNR